MTDEDVDIIDKTTRYEGFFRVEVLPFAAVRAMLEAGKITNAMTIIALQWLLLNREALRRKWGAV